MFLENIYSPDDLKPLTYPEMRVLAKEIRGEILSTVSKNGGHLASNLGTVELTLALHKVLDTPKDKIVWDVGHQSYTHKLLTKRRESFSTLRKDGGISGFPKQSESEYDSFIGGHSGTSISAALGIAKATKIRGDDCFSVAVIGDGSFSNGLAYEGMNNAGRSGEKLIIIINDNEMSISKNVGSISKYLTKIRLSKPYFDLKDSAKDFLSKLPVIGESLKNAISISKRTVKQVVYHSNMFEDFGFKYLGPVDGHDTESLCQVLERAKEYACPCVIHIKTIKGKGYKPAELLPSIYHGVSPFDIKKGVEQKKDGVDSSFSAVFGSTMLDLADKNSNFAVITAAMADGTGLGEYEKKYSGTDKFFDAGIAEGHALTFAAGLASNGVVPVFAVYSTFLQRGYDQLIHDLSIEQKHAVIAIDRAGIVGADGETHQGVFDIAMLKTIPNIKIYSPSTYSDLREQLTEAVLNDCGVIAVRYPKGAETELALKYSNDENTLINYIDNNCKDVLLVSYGRTHTQALQAMEQLMNRGIRVSVLELKRVYPIPDEAIEISCEYNRIIFIEEGIRSGSIAESFAARCLESGYHGSFSIRAIDNRFVAHGSVENAYIKLGLDAESIITEVLGE